jgi:hypothetical protein
MARFDPAKRALAIKRMLALPQPVKRRVHAQLEANSKELVEMQQRVVAKDEGDLAASIKYEDISDEGRIAFRVTAGGPTTTREVRAGSGKSYDYANAVEHGTSDTKAKPFFFPSYRAKRKAFKAGTNKAARAGVKEAMGS